MGEKQKPDFPLELFESDQPLNMTERVARMGRFAVLQELGYFGEQTNLSLARKDRAGSFIAQTRKQFSGIYGSVEGCSPGDIENAALYLDCFDDMWDVPESTGRYLKDK